MSRAGATVITGMGAAASIGVGLDAFWSGIAAGRTGIRAALRFSTQAYGVSLGVSLDAAALPPDTLDRDPDSGSDLDPCAALAIVAAREALDRSGIARASLPPHRLAIVMSTSAGGLHARSAYEFTDPRDRARRHRLSSAAASTRRPPRSPQRSASTACD